MALHALEQVNHQRGEPELPETVRVWAGANERQGPSMKEGPVVEDDELTRTCGPLVAAICISTPSCDTACGPPFRLTLCQ
jgi:hypothetical protein